MKLRAVLMRALNDHISRSGQSWVEIARLFGVTQPHISNLMRSKIDLFTLDALVNMAAAVGMRIELRLVA